MKVVFSGFSKCGTKSMAAALRELGYTVYDFMEHYENHCKEWTKICTQGGTREDFRKMYENVDAVTDLPAYHFWEEILDAFPDAKIIHCERENEDKWFDSWYRQMVVADSFAEKLFIRFSPSWWHMYEYCKIIIYPVVGHSPENKLFHRVQVNELLARMSYRRHNDYIRNNAPKDQLLIWKFGDGWKPICQFLNLPVPDKPFPHSNKNCTVWKDLGETNKTLQWMMLESCVMMFLFTCLSGYGAYKWYKSQGFIPFVRFAFDKICGWLGY